MTTAAHRPPTPFTYLRDEPDRSHASAMRTGHKPSGTRVAVPVTCVGQTAPFSGTVALEDSSSRLATWTLRALRPGESWATVVPLAPAGPLKDVHVTDRSGLRSLTIAPLASHGGNTQ